jgi:uncharacterized membrane protein
MSAVTIERQIRPRLIAEAFPKHRLELFSDGVFAILLALLVLDFKAPRHGGLEGLSEIAPGLSLHALAFIAVSVAWVSHHRALTILLRINPGILWANLLTLFPATLIPYGLSIDADNATDPLGAAFLGVDLAAYAAAIALFRIVADTVLAGNPVLAAFNRRRAAATALFAAISLVASVALYRWFAGYAVAFATLPLALFMPPAPAGTETREPS